MKDEQIEQQLKTLKEQLPINQELKEGLRRSFPDKNKGNRVKRYYGLIAMAAAACLAFLFYTFAPDTFVVKANAAALKISNQISFVDIGSGPSLSVAENKGTVYIPVSGKGLFAYNQNGFRQLLDKEVSFVSVSKDGNKLALSDGNIKIYDTATAEVKELLRGDSSSTFYEQPEFSTDGKRLLYVKKIIEPQDPHGFKEKESGIYELDLTSLRSQKLADGSYPSYAKNNSAIVYEKDNKLVYRDLESESQQVIDTGRFPSVSPDGNYVAYVKEERTKQKLADNAYVEEAVSNVWVADLAFEARKKVTANYPNRYMDEKEWAKGLETGGVPNVLTFSGTYDYYDPVWSSNSESLYVLKKRNTEGSPMRLMRIDFSSEKLTAADTVKRFAQSLVVRDDDYAKSLMKSPPPFLTVSNPHQVGYRIIKTGQEGDKEYVDAEIYSAYTANPGYYINKLRFYLSPNENGYIIDKIDKQSDIAVFSKDNRDIVLGLGDKEETIIKDGDIPVQYLPEGDYRFASLAYSEQTSTLFFTIQQLQDKGQKAAVKIISYNLSDKKFTLIDEVDSIDGKLNVGVENLILDPQSEYAALDLFSDDDETFRSYSYVYNLKNKNKVDISSLFKNAKLESVHTKFWDENSLILDISSYGESLSYFYQPEQRTLNNF